VSTQRRPDLRTVRQSISIVTGPGSRRVLRLLLPDECRFDCAGCPFAVGPGGRDASLEGLASAVLSAYRLGLCDTVFILAGVPRDPSASTRRLLEFVELLRFTHGFLGYLHVKALPGAESGLTQRLVQLVDRVSYALEVPCAAALHDLGGLAPEAARALETTAFAELQRARRASARSSPPLLPAAFRPARTGRQQLQPSLFETRTNGVTTDYENRTKSRYAKTA
jgi:predicted DNA-binding helix-hairpin-helix protein